MVYRLAWFLARLLLHALFGFSIRGKERVPKTGPVILAANHLSILDPIAIGVAVWRPVSFFARADVFRLPVLSWLLPRLYAIPVERGESDLSAIKKALRTLERGFAFGIFPEGTRSRTGRLQPFKTGVAAIALRTGTPVVPVAVMGTEKALPVGARMIRLRRPIRVVFGDPIPVPKKERPSREDLLRLTREIEAKVAELLDPPYRPT
ncbi:lysophospholipid acyltransferase family protein [Thermus filiformis]|uniref:Acyl-phosphate glycerol 3-phosphate acyltransferase n=1 Tax=Thermus filiformis TaxID=276 RepID=A0A0D6XBB8_THEFI|nr:lysophospholipid acyltransferase family protein [Thermus filiformis]KIX84626.1 acyl-phosphate glycerol 3-phosphate acyltransferase [Thermus filiformis]